MFKVLTFKRIADNLWLLMFWLKAIFWAYCGDWSWTLWESRLTMSWWQGSVSHDIGTDSCKPQLDNSRVPTVSSDAQFNFEINPVRRSTTALEWKSQTGSAAPKVWKHINGRTKKDPQYPLNYLFIDPRLNQQSPDLNQKPNLETFWEISPQCPGTTSPRVQAQIHFCGDAQRLVPPTLLLLGAYTRDPASARGTSQAVNCPSAVQG